MNPYPISKFPSRWSPGCLNWGVKGDNLPPPTHTHTQSKEENTRVGQKWTIGWWNMAFVCFIISKISVLDRKITNLKKRLTT